MTLRQTLVAVVFRNEIGPAHVAQRLGAERAFTSLRRTDLTPTQDVAGGADKRHHHPPPTRAYPAVLPPASYNILDSRFART